MQLLHAQKCLALSPPCKPKCKQHCKNYFTAIGSSTNVMSSSCFFCFSIIYHILKGHLWYSSSFHFLARFSRYSTLELCRAKFLKMSLSFSCKHSQRLYKQESEPALFFFILENDFKGVRIISINDINDSKGIRIRIREENKLALAEC